MVVIVAAATVAIGWAAVLLTSALSPIGGVVDGTWKLLVIGYITGFLSDRTDLLYPKGALPASRGWTTPKQRAAERRRLGIQQPLTGRLFSATFNAVVYCLIGGSAVLLRAWLWPVSGWLDGIWKPLVVGYLCWTLRGLNRGLLPPAAVNQSEKPVVEQQQV